MASAEPLAAPPGRTLESILMAASRGVRRAYDIRLVGLDLKLSEAFLLGHVHTHGPMTQTQLAESLGIGRAATGSIIDALERKDLVERSAHAGDRRVWLVATTERAGPVVDQLAAVDVALREELWTGISRAERRQLSEILLRLQGNLAAILTDQI
ncbi:MAG: MarR family transcriptional regulator, transcriptional regulator for hemolysin [Actinomycetota bacterium]|jgi:DNA-binding MarR family transcriptional regulator|nr:MarR family transcriptional regulator, transcriptional regulator for hemolysin [Actinomycetota bacterium]MDQ1508088.1 MarR family transcriptional regulator, transcriptional regulator for hemolysin [Actinomycetota bacterium]